jgi:hypothetical protein
MIPAVGWSATFINMETHMKGDSRPLVCWALMEDGSLKGMVADGQSIKAVTEMREEFSSYHCFNAAHTM